MACACMRIHGAKPTLASLLTLVVLSVLFGAFVLALYLTRSGTQEETVSSLIVIGVTVVLGCFAGTWVPSAIYDFIDRRF